MNRFIGKIGYATTVTVGTVSTETFVEKTYTFTKERLKQNNSNSSTVNSDTKITMEVSVLTDAFLQSAWTNIRYITYLNKQWKVELVDPTWPRMTLSIGGLYR